MSESSSPADVAAEKPVYICSIGWVNGEPSNDAVNEISQSLQSTMVQFRYRFRNETGAQWRNPIMDFTFTRDDHLSITTANLDWIVAFNRLTHEQTGLCFNTGVQLDKPRSLPAHPVYIGSIGWVNGEPSNDAVNQISTSLQATMKIFGYHFRDETDARWRNAIMEFSFTRDRPLNIAMANLDWNNSFVRLTQEQTGLCFSLGVKIEPA